MVNTFRLPGSGSEERARFNVDFYNQWAGIFGRNNWYDFDFIKVAVEHSPYKGSTELEARLLGIGLVITYVWDWGFTDGLVSMKDEIEANLKGVTGATTINDPYGVLDELADKPKSGV
jgi:hypothetical protein